MPPDLVGATVEVRGPGDTEIIRSATRAPVVTHQQAPTGSAPVWDPAHRAAAEAIATRGKARDFPRPVRSGSTLRFPFIGLSGPSCPGASSKTLVRKPFSSPSGHVHGFGFTALNLMHHGQLMPDQRSGRCVQLKAGHLPPGGQPGKYELPTPGKTSCVAAKVELLG